MHNMRELFWWRRRPTSECNCNKDGGRLGWNTVFCGLPEQVSVLDTTVAHAVMCHTSGFLLPAEGQRWQCVQVLQRSSPDSDLSFTSVADLAHVLGVHFIYLTITDKEMWSRHGGSTEGRMQQNNAECCTKFRIEIGLHILEAGT